MKKRNGWMRGASVLCSLLGGAALLAAEPAAPAAEKGAAPAAGEKVIQVNPELPLKEQISRLRGKVLYRKGQVRKLEQAACAANAELQASITKLEQDRRLQLIAAEPRLQRYYEELDELEKEIQQLKEKIGK